MLALDYGTRRIGVAVSDALRIVATPLAVIPAGGALDKVRELVAEYEPDVVVIGLPVGLSGREGPAADAARDFARSVEAATGVDVEMVDERFTTHTAEAAMLEAGVGRRRRRAELDKVAASVILQQYLARHGRPGSNPP